MNNLIIDYNNINDLIKQNIIKYNNQTISFNIDFSISIKNLIIKIKEIEELYCLNKGIKYLDVTELINLKTLFCSNNKLQEPMDEIHRLKVCFAHFELNLTNNTQLKQLYCSKNQLQELNINNNINLKELDCSNNQLKELNLNNNINLKKFLCEENQ